MSSDRAPDDAPTSVMPGRSELIATAVLILCVILVAGSVAVFAGGDATVQPSASPTAVPSDGATQDTGVPTDTNVFSPADADGEAIVALAEKSIEVLPLGAWPTLYGDFTADFQVRCSLEEFTQAGIEGANALGDSLPLLGYKSMHDVVITGDTATGVIRGELRGQSEYDVEAAFVRVDGVWKLSPAPNTTGCSAFNRLGE